MPHLRWSALIVIVSRKENTRFRTVAHIRLAFLGRFHFVGEVDRDIGPKYICQDTCNKYAANEHALTENPQCEFFPFSVACDYV